MMWDEFRQRLARVAELRFKIKSLEVDDIGKINFSLERIVELDPDIILLNTMGEVDECRDRLRREFESNAAWSSLRAIQNGRFYVLPKQYFLYKPNDKYPEALRYLAGLLYENSGTGDNAALPPVAVK
jgi:iron complex transport system substrate-binding protein